jgi:phosphatidate cytidylyltransferase
MTTARSNLQLRLMTAALLISGVVAALYLASNEVWRVLTLIVTLLAAWEWAGLAGLKTNGRALYTLGLGALAVAISVLPIEPLYLFLPASVFWWLIAPLWLSKGWATTAARLLPLGLILLPSFWWALIELRAISPNVILAIIGAIAIADSAAYFTGRRFGKRKLAPAISPGKTIEGALGAAVAVLLYGLALYPWWPLCGIDCLPRGLGFFALMLILSIVGDLFESWIKRQAGVKDSGTLLPGHGGVLDRLDSLIATLPVAALLWYWFTR